MPEPVPGNLCPHVGCGGERFELKTRPGPNDSVYNHCLDCGGFSMWREHPVTGEQTMQAIEQEPPGWQ